MPEYFRTLVISALTVALGQAANGQAATLVLTNGNGACFAVELEYVVDEQGRVEAETARIVRTNNQAYAESYISVLPQLKYEPALLNGVAVRQIVEDKRGMQVRVVVVPEGQRPSLPSRPPRPTC